MKVVHTIVYIWAILATIIIVGGICIGKRVLLPTNERKCLKSANGIVYYTDSVSINKHSYIILRNCWGMEVGTLHNVNCCECYGLYD